MRRGELCRRWVFHLGVALAAVSLYKYPAGNSATGKGLGLGIPPMGKEIKIGLIVIAVLLCLFGGALYLRLRHESPAVAQAANSHKKSTGKKSPAKHSASDTAAGQDERGERKDQKGGKGKSLFAALPDSDRDGRGHSGASDARSAGENPYSAHDDEPASRPHRNAWSSAETADDAAADNEAPDDRNFAAHDAAGNAGAIGGDRYSAYASRRNGVASDDDAGNGEQGAVIGAADGADPAEQAAGESLSDGYRLTSETDRPGAAATDDAVEMPDDRFQLSSADGRGEAAGIEAGDKSFSGASLDDGSSHEAAGALLPRDSATGTDEEFASDTAADTEDQLADEPQPRGLAAPAQFERLDSHVRPLAGAESGSREAAGDIADEEAPALAATDDARPLAAGEGERSYTVAANDNFWRISQKLYGTGAYFKALREYNRQRYAGAEVMNVGDELAVPSLETLRRDYPALCPKQRRATATRPTASLVSSGARPRRGREYTVAEGDTLFDIARHELGKASRWLEVYELNREQLGDDFNYLAPGMRLALPADGPAADPVTTRDTRDRYQR